MTVEELRAKYGAVEGKEVGEKPPIMPLSISVEGLEGTGKSQFPLLTCPTPLVHINFGDRSAKNFLYKMGPRRRAATTLYEFQPKSSEGFTRAEGLELMTRLSAIAKGELSDGKMAGGTFVLDSGSSWWDTVQEVKVAPILEGQGKKTGGLAYGAGNLIISGVFSWLKNQGANVIITHRKKQDWDAKGPIEGQFSAQLNSKIPYLVEARIDLRTVCSECGAPNCRKIGHQGLKHIGRILKFGSNTGFVGYEQEGLDFNMVYSLYHGVEYPNQEALKND